ncbi:hypothetical protein G210_5644 [Candida maltosa Xu316]|uniref:Uncharacterized protein n=1 Tax=Candida maltosa (strain Xu316) TaxID=1245528 RepID=M3K488_CANMX|nr:hypothetical protein G210_5644 [Candida maltosa Xu316]
MNKGRKGTQECGAEKEEDKEEERGIEKKNTSHNRE